MEQGRQQHPLVVSKGPPPCIPDVSKSSVLTRPRRFRPSLHVSPQNQFNDTVPKDRDRHEPRGHQEHQGSESGIALLVSDGPTPVKCSTSAASRTSGAGLPHRSPRNNPGFTPKESDVFSDTIPAGTVIAARHPRTRRSNRRRRSPFLVSKGPQLIPIPNLVGMPVEAAAAQLTRSG